MTDDDLTDAQAKALRILDEHGPLRPQWFASKMWPDSDAWNNLVNCGPKGVHRGGGMYRAAGGYLGRLVKAGLARRFYPEHGVKYDISAKGKRLVREGNDG